MKRAWLSLALATCAGTVNAASPPPAALLLAAVPPPTAASPHSTATSPPAAAPPPAAPLPVAVPLSPPADTILRNGEIRLPNGWAHALAVSHGVIVAIGDDATVDHHRANGTRVINLNGATVLPGLHDMHVHPLMAGQTQLQCMFPQGSSEAIVVEAIRKCAGTHAKGEWIVGGQWDTSSLGAHPDWKALDKAAPDNPVALTDISLHGLWVNSIALRLANITPATANPPGGVIEKDAKGEPTGVLRESAGALVRSRIPAYTLEQNAKALSWSMKLMMSYGITSYTDALVDESALKAYALLADQGELKQRVKACLVWGRSLLTAGNAPQTDFITLRNLYARERFSPSCIKILLDGVPTDGHTAAMVEQYADAKSPDDPRAKGLLMVPAAELKKALINFDAQGFTVKMHAAGDGAVRAGLDAIEAARHANGFSGLMHEVAHNSFVQVSDIRRARDIAATFEMSPYIWYPNPIIPDIAKAVGAERMKRWIPVKEAIDAGALVVPGSDWSVVPSVNPWIAIETLVTRQQPGGGKEELAAAEKIALSQAIDLFTVNSAREMGDRTRVGTLERGMLADLIVLDRNPYRIPVTQVHDTKVKMTMINGEIVYGAN
jgi:predicted amidohydrolase YtcJ